MIREIGKLPEHLRRSITWDRGTELAENAQIQTALDLTLYFCDPHSPWQRGSNENTNRLLRFRAPGPGSGTRPVHPGRISWNHTETAGLDRVRR
ncbi:hypothetical protein SAMN05216281_108132 [Cryobacterium luteum]|nr:hypothetical protein SAMN05216281_108132 [Cryobacterium luteum]